MEQKGKQLGRRSDGLGPGLVLPFSEFSPEGVQHQFGRRFSAGIFLNAGIVQVYTLSFSVLRQVLLLFFFRVTPSWPTGGFLL